MSESQLFGRPREPLVHGWSRKSEIQKGGLKRTKPKETEVALCIHKNPQRPNCKPSEWTIPNSVVIINPGLAQINYYSGLTGFRILRCSQGELHIMME